MILLYQILIAFFFVGGVDLPDSPRPPGANPLVWADLLPHRTSGTAPRGAALRGGGGAGRRGRDVRRGARPSNAPPLARACLSPWSSAAPHTLGSPRPGLSVTHWLDLASGGYTSFQSPSASHDHHGSVTSVPRRAVDRGAADGRYR